MSDDTPTQRLPQAGDEPTELTKERTKSRALLFTLIGVGAALLVALIVLLVLLLGQGAPTPGPTPTSSDTPSPTPTASESPTPSATPTASESPTPTAAPPPPPPPSPIVSYTASATDAGCPDDSSSVPLTFNWNTTGSSVNFGIATDFADAQPYQTDLPAVGGITVNYVCSNATTKFSIAVFFNGDVIDRETITVQR